MTLEEIRCLCLSFPGATEQIQWGDDLLFKVAGKMFLCMGMGPDGGVSFKCPEETFHELTEEPGVRPAPYLARAHWIQVDPMQVQIESDRLATLIRQSYDLVVAKLPKKTQRALAER